MALCKEVLKVETEKKHIRSIDHVTTTVVMEQISPLIFSVYSVFVFNWETFAFGNRVAAAVVVVGPSHSAVALISISSICLFILY
jgi:hypothetical protein